MSSNMSHIRVEPQLRHLRSSQLSNFSVTNERFMFHVPCFMSVKATSENDDVTKSCSYDDNFSTSLERVQRLAGR